MDRSREVIGAGFELGALSDGTGIDGFYERRGWIPWAGTTWVARRAASSEGRRTTEAIYVLWTPATPELDLDGNLVCDWRFRGRLVSESRRARGAASSRSSRSTPTSSPAARGRSRSRGSSRTGASAQGSRRRSPSPRPDAPTSSRSRGEAAQRRSLLLNAHMDTVGVAGMTAPFEPRLDGGRLYGRGAYDMKGSLAACMLATAEAARRGLRGDVILTAVSDEEFASVGTEAVAASISADAAIVDRADGAAARGRAPRLRARRARDDRPGRARLAAAPRDRRDREDGPRPRRRRGARPSAARESDPPVPRKRERARVADRGRPGVLELPRSLRRPGRAADDPGRDGRAGGGRAAGDPRARRRGRRGLRRDVRVIASREPFEVDDTSELVGWCGHAAARALGCRAGARRRLVLGRLGAACRARACRPSSSARSARARTPRSSGSTSGRSSAASRSTSPSRAGSAPRRRGSRRSPRTSRRVRPTAPSVRPGRRRPRAGPQRAPMRVEQVVVREVGALAEHEERRDVDVLEARCVRGHLAVRRDDGGLAVAVAQAAVVADVDVLREVLDDELSAREVELALVVAALDQLVEGDVRLLLPCVLGGGECDVSREQDRRVEEDEPRDELRRSRRELEREASAERVADEDGLARPDRLDDRGEVRCRCPTAAPRASGRARGGRARGRGGAGALPRARRSGRRGCGPRAGRRRAAPPARPTRGARGSLRVFECVQRLGYELGAPLVALLHERPDHGAARVDQERTAVRCSVRLVEDAVRLRRGAVGPEVGREGVLGAELLLPRLPRCRGVARDEHDLRARVAERTRGSPAGRAPRPRTRA